VAVVSHSRLTVLSALLWASLAGTAAASPPDLFGFGQRTAGLAMTGTSYETSYEAVFSNPAGLGAGRTRNLTFGFTGGGYQLQVDGIDSPLTPPRGIVIGFALPLPFGDILEDRLVFGGGFYTPAEVLLRGNIRFPQAIQWSVLERAQVVAVMVGLGVDLHGVVDGLQLGFGVNALASVFGELSVRLDETNSFSSVVETQLLTSFAPTAGEMADAIARAFPGFAVDYQVDASRARIVASWPGSRTRSIRGSYSHVGEYPYLEQ